MKKEFKKQEIFKQASYNSLNIPNYKLSSLWLIFLAHQKR